MKTKNLYYNGIYFKILYYLCVNNIICKPTATHEAYATSKKKKKRTDNLQEVEDEIYSIIDV